MSTIDRHNKFRPTVMALAMAAAFTGLATGSARAADEEEEGEAGPLQASVSVGVAGVTGDSSTRAWFGEYNGLRTNDAAGLLDFSYWRVDQEEARSVVFTGRNIGLDTRELGFTWKKQGDWKFAAQYGELVHYDPRTGNSGIAGGGTSTPAVNVLPGGQGTGEDVLFKTKRKSFGLSFSKWLAPEWAVEVSASTENKDGSRLGGIGFNCPSTVAPGCAGTTTATTGWATLMIPEPINQNHTQLEARVNYAGEKLRVSLGYYGSFFKNDSSAITPLIPGALNNPVGTTLPLAAGLRPILGNAIAVAPDNQANNFDVTGSYLFSPTTRANFKFGYGEAKQTQDFAGAGLSGAPAGITNLDAKTITTVAQAGFSSRPMPKLAILGDVRWVDRQDHTPIAAYNLEGSTTYTNFRMPNTRLNGKLQASYSLTETVTGTLGWGYESIDRGSFTRTSAIRGVAAIREKTDEQSWRVELRRRFADEFSGSVSYVSSRRDGTSWLGANSGTGVTPITDFSSPQFSTSPFVSSMANRQREKIRLVGNWQPSDELSLQLTVDGGQDSFSMPSGYGLQGTRMALVNLDATYQISEQWSVNGYLAAGNQAQNQNRYAGYVMAFENRNATVGLGFTGKPSDKLSLGGGLSFINDRNIYAQTLDKNGTPSNAALLASSGGLPDVTFQRLELRGFGRYVVNKNDAVRADLVYQHVKYDDWAWGYNGVSYAYSDASTVSYRSSASVTYLGLTYIHTWQ